MPPPRPRPTTPRASAVPVQAPSFASRAMPQALVRQVLQNTIEPLFPGGGANGRLIIADRSYIPVDAGWLRTLVTSDPLLGRANYRGDVFDCDDYVMYLRCKTSLVARREELAAPLAVGFLLTQLHAFNFCIGEGGSISIVDTQSDDVPIHADPRYFPDALELGTGNALDLVYI